MKTYKNFLEQKLVRHIPAGFKPEISNPMLLEWQSSVASWACRTGRAALFEDCGLGKTPQQLVYAQNVTEHTGGNVLILAPLAVSQQTKREGLKFGIDVNIASCMDDIRPGINITNYEKLDRFDPSAFTGVVLDESSILKSYMGATKRKIIQAFKDTPYRLACTATPAPNDLMELLNHAEFLGVMRSSEALSIWFIADQSNSGKYRLKSHAVKDFWQWVSSWAVCISKPSDIGFADDGYILPELTEINEIVNISELSDNLESGMLRNIGTSATDYHAEKKRSLKERVRRTVEIAGSIKNEQLVIWCYRDDEADELKRALEGSVEIRGKDNPKKKEQCAADFIDGKFNILISKPSIFGYGLNFQNCNSCIFCGMDYSYESYYQSVRRFYRFGQTKPVKVWRVLGSTELHILNTVEAKQRQKNEMQRSMSEAMKGYQSEAVHGRSYKLDTAEQIVSIPRWLRSAV